jgi:sugar/nucleoside kinase (ribokinase family)
MWSTRPRRRGPDRRHPLTASADRVTVAAPRDYLAVGHVTVDVLPGGERRAGGTALYSALQAARLGLRASILTRGEERELSALLAPFAEELDVLIQPAAQTTTLATSGDGAQRRQRILAWAGPIDTAELPPGSILHLAPVAAEISGAPIERRPFVGLTPQGLVRSWAALGDQIVACPLPASQLPLAEACDAIVLSDQERGPCATLIDRARAAGATVAITAGPGATEILLPGGGPLELALEPLAAPADDLGAGDVYAAAFFAMLAAGESGEAAARTAAAAAALRITGVGPGAIAGSEPIAARAAAAAASSAGR